MAKNEYYLDEGGIKALAKTFINKFVSSKYYTSLENKITELGTKVDNLVSGGTSTDIVSVSYELNSSTSFRSYSNNDQSVTYSGLLNNPYPEGFNMDNSTIIMSDISAVVNNNRKRLSIPVYYRFNEYHIEFYFVVHNLWVLNGFGPIQITLYFTKKK